MLLMKESVFILKEKNNTTLFFLLLIACISTKNLL